MSVPKYRIATLKTLPADAIVMGADAADRERFGVAIIGVADSPIGKVAVYDADEVVV